MSDRTTDAEQEAIERTRERRKKISETGKHVPLEESQQDSQQESGQSGQGSPDSPGNSQQSSRRQSSR